MLALKLDELREKSRLYPKASREVLKEMPEHISGGSLNSGKIVMKPSTAYTLPSLRLSTKNCLCEEVHFSGLQLECNGIITI
jgi:hypothetical protein